MPGRRGGHPSACALVQSRLPKLKREMSAMLWRNWPAIASRWSTSTSAGLAVGGEEPRLVQEGHEGLRFFEHVAEIVVVDHHLGWVQLEIDLVEVRAGPAGQMSVEKGPLVMDRCLSGILVGGRPDGRSPLGEPLLQCSTSNLVVLFALG